MRNILWKTFFQSKVSGIFFQFYVEWFYIELYEFRVVLNEIFLVSLESMCLSMVYWCFCFYYA